MGAIIIMTACLMFYAVSHGTLQTVINPCAEAVPTESAKA